MLVGELLVEGLNVLLIEGNLSGLLGIHASEGFGHGRFPGSRPADDESGVALREIHCHIVKDRQKGYAKVTSIISSSPRHPEGRIFLKEVGNLSREGDQVG